MSELPRFAFLTPEFPTEAQDGGVGSYVSKMAIALGGCGMTAEVFVPSETTERIDYHGVTVHRVARADGFWFRVLHRLAVAAGGKHGGRLFRGLRDAWALSRALEARHARYPFAAVQSANYQLVGFFVRKRAERRHLIRVSTSRVLWDAANGDPVAAPQRWMERLDVHCMRRADNVYAPSRYLADYFGRRHGVDVDVLRPPLVLPLLDEFGSEPQWPTLYLLHFGLLSDRKGTDLVAAALSRALETDPTIRMVWAGGQKGETYVDEIFRRFPTIRDNVLWLGKVEKPRLYWLINACTATVLPSRADNLPNTVIESLMLQRPVLGFADASLDELVEHGRNGYLLPAGDVDALGKAMVDLWQEPQLLLPDGFVPSRSEIFETSPQDAAQKLIRIACGASQYRRPLPAGT